MSSSDEDSSNVGSSRRYFTHYPRRPPPRFHAWSFRLPRAIRPKVLLSIPEDSAAILNQTSYQMASEEQQPPATNGIHQDVSSSSTPPPPPPPPVPITFDVSLFKSYLLSLLPPVIGATVEELQNTLFDSDFDERVIKFAGETGSAIYVVKTKEEVEG